MKIVFLGPFAYAVHDNASQKKTHPRLAPDTALASVRNASPTYAGYAAMMAFQGNGHGWLARSRSVRDINTCCLFLDPEKKIRRLQTPVT